MLGFIVPIKPISTSKNWEFDNLLLERTVKSICNQTVSQFRLFIIFNEMPSIDFKHDNIYFIPFPFKSVTISEIEDKDYILKYYKEDYAEKMFDKARKITYGAKIAIEHGCEYLMPIDSDDLISNKIAEFVLNTNSKLNSPGWRIKKGYIHKNGSNLLYKKFDIQNINGGTHIIRKDLVKIPDFSKNIFWNFNLFESHGYTYSRLKDYHNQELHDYPFYGIIYIISGINYSNIQNRLRLNGIMKIIKIIILGKVVTKKIRKEFNLYKV